MASSQTPKAVLAPLLLIRPPLRFSDLPVIVLQTFFGVDPGGFVFPHELWRLKFQLPLKTVALTSGKRGRMQNKRKKHTQKSLLAPLAGWSPFSLERGEVPKPLVCSTRSLSHDMYMKYIH